MAERSSDLPRVVVIGGGGTGIATLYDLARRGFPAVLVERGELTSGTTGRHHGQLHSGARYAVHDPHIGAECMAEADILAHIAWQAVERNYGLFIALNDDDLAYEPEFIEGCRAAGIPARKVSVEAARRYGPAISPDACAAVLVPDGTIDAFRLPLQFAASALTHGATINTFTEAISIETTAGRVCGVGFRDRASGTNYEMRCDVVINAGGAWGGEIAALAGCTLDITPSPGTMVAFEGRLVDLVVSRLKPPGDGDIVVPQRLQTIVGSTQSLIEDPDDAVVYDGDVEWLRNAGAQLIPGLKDAQVRAAWSAPRPLAGPVSGNARSISRDFSCIDHGARDNVVGMFSVIGGKATVLRRMAESTVDLVCAEYSVNRTCSTANEPLEDYRRYFQMHRDDVSIPREMAN